MPFRAALLILAGLFPAPGAATPGDPRAEEPDAETGRARVHSAQVASMGEWRLGLGLGFFTNGSFPRPLTDHSQTSGRLALAAAPWEGIEAFGSLGFLANRNEKTIPQLIQAVGDLELGAKWSRELGPGVRVGALAALQLPSGVGSVSLAPDALGGAVAALAGWSGTVGVAGGTLRLVVRTELGATLDRTAALLPAKPIPTMEQEYSLGTARYSRAHAGLWLGAGAGGIAGFCELSADVAIGLTTAALQTTTRGTPATASELRQLRVSPGLRWAPVRGLTFEAALELGVPGAVIRGFAAAPPWMGRASATFAFDPTRAAEAPPPAPELPLPLPEPEVLVREAPTTGWIEGHVLQADGTPLEGAIVSFTGSGGPPVASDAAGLFRSYPMPAGTVGLVARRTGFLGATASVGIAVGQAVGATLILFEPPPPTPSAALVISACDERGRTIAGTVRLSGAQARQQDTPAQGAVRIEGLPPGDYVVTVMAPGRLARRRTVTLTKGWAVAEMCLPAAAQVSSLEATEGGWITRQLKFGKAGATAPESDPVLSEIADALLRRPLLTGVRVEVHVDASAGKPAKLVAQSQAQAEAIARALGLRGVPVDTMVASGLGGARPITKGKDKKAKTQNTRVAIVPLP